MADKKIKIQGQLIEVNNQSLGRCKIEALEVNGGSLGKVAIEDGHFAFLINLKSFQTKARQVYFQIWKGRKKLLPDTKAFMQWSPRISLKLIVIYIDLKKEQVVNLENQKKYSITGKIVSKKGIGAVGLQVKVFLVEVGKEILLGETVTDANGNYKIEYPVELSGAGAISKRDIQVVVIDPENEEKTVGKSSIVYNSKEEESIHIQVPNKVVKVASEFEQITQELRAFMEKNKKGAISFKDLKENDDSQDITYLANKSGWDARLVAMVALSDQFAEENEILPAFNYALFRAGLPSNHNGLSHISADRIKAIWNKAIEENIVPASLKRKISSNLNILRKKQATILLEQKAPVGGNSIRDMLSLTFDKDTDQIDFVDLYHNNKEEMTKFWAKIDKKYGKPVSEKLQLNGKLGFLTLNNKDLVTKLFSSNQISNNPTELVRKGLYNEENWLTGKQAILDDQVSIPMGLKGDNDQEKRRHYAGYMATQLKLAYPTSVMAEMIKNDELKLKGSNGEKDIVHQFLIDNEGEFEIGRDPIGKYLEENAVEIPEEEKNIVTSEIGRVQRVYQITPTDKAMQALLEKDVDSSLAVVQFGEEAFIDQFAESLGGEQIAKMTFNRAHQVHSTIFNLTTTYLTHRNMPNVYGITGKMEKLVGDIPNGPSATLETVFGEMDYCECEHCRSVLSPAAYLVDLLHFLDNNKVGSNPLDVLLGNKEREIVGKRPDIQHLQLTCENTNTVLPYIDLSNEILEYYIANGSIEDYVGHNIEGEIDSEELLANPQFVKEEVYTGQNSSLKEQVYPFILPFNQPLEALRLYFDHFDVPLFEAIEKLRIDNEPETWENIRMEYLGISKEEYDIFTQNAHNVTEYFGATTHLNDFFTEGDTYSKNFTRNTGITYKELTAIVKTQFINPHSHLIPKLKNLYVNIYNVISFLNGEISDQNFKNLLPEELDETPYGGSVTDWLRENADKIKSLILLIDVHHTGDECSFEELELRYADNVTLFDLDYFKLLRFIRLWKKLGWTIDLTDKAMAALYNWEECKNIIDLNEGFKTCLNRLAVVKKVTELLGLRIERDLLKVLAFWSNIDTHGKNSLYRKLFLRLSILKLDRVFEEDGYGNYLQDENEKVLGNIEILQAALNIRGEEIAILIEGLGFNEDTPLFLENVSAIFRCSFLARAMRLHVSELMALKKVSGLDPFADPEEGQPQILQFINMAQLLLEAGFKVSTLQYLLLNEDISGKAMPTQEEVLFLVRTIRDTFVGIEQENQVEEDPNGDIARDKMALVYGNEVANQFFGWVEKTIVHEVEYLHHQPELEEEIIEISDRIRYDHFRKQLSFNGFMSESLKMGFLNLGIPNGFDQKVEALWQKIQDSHLAFFNQYLKLKEIYDQFTVSQDMGTILEYFLPDYIAKAKILKLKQLLTSTLDVDVSLLDVLLVDPTVLNAAPEEIGGTSAEPAITDFFGLEEAGISAYYHFEGIDQIRYENIENINFTQGAMELPEHPVNPNQGIDAEWKFYLEVVENGFFNFYFETHPTAEVNISLDGENLDLIVADKIWSNQQAIELEAGKLHEFVVSAAGIRHKAILRWESEVFSAGLIPNEYFRPYHFVQRFKQTYNRIKKSTFLLNKLGFSAKELSYFSGLEKMKVNDQGFLNALPAIAQIDRAVIEQLFNCVFYLLKYSKLKHSLNIKDDALVVLFQNPDRLDELGNKVLYVVTGWNEQTVSDLLDHFALDNSDLSDLDTFIRINEAQHLIRQLGAPAPSILDWTTNQPDTDAVRSLQSILRGRYEDEAWLKIVQPINDVLRTKQRDALVAHVLFQMQQYQDTAHIDTPNKLFEHFLIDVEMDPAMKTSRIKQAIASVQLFVQRCLLGLEYQKHKISPHHIKKGQWEWMQRYRVWEANRKIFLYPENWLEPEFRDNKTPFFQELESTLLQADITQDLAHKALVNYLEKLDTIAKLEICGLCKQENAPNNPFDDILHVFGRTAGTNRKYYYRRFEGGNWTPWEKIDLDIEDNPILPVVWDGRLFLFWLSIKQKPEENGAKAPIKEDGPLLEASVSDLEGESLTTIEFHLNWSEYLNHKWQSRNSSELSKSMNLFEEVAFASLKDSSSIINILRTTINFSSFIDDESDNLYLFVWQREHLNLDERKSCIGFFKLIKKQSMPSTISSLQMVEYEVSYFNRSKKIIEVNRALGLNENNETILFASYYKIIPKLDAPENTSEYAWTTLLRHIETLLYYFKPGSREERWFVHSLTGPVPLPPDRGYVIESQNFYGNHIQTPFFFQDKKHVFLIQPRPFYGQLIDYTLVYGLNNSSSETSDIDIDIAPIIDRTASELFFEIENIKDPSFEAIRKEFSKVDEQVLNLKEALADTKIGKALSTLEPIPYHGREIGVFSSRKP